MNSIYMRFVAFLVSMLSICVSCKVRNESNQVIDTLAAVTNQDPRIHRIVNNFFPLDTNVVFKEDNFLFSKSSRWDTSFVLILKREPLKVSGVYYELTPRNNMSVAAKRKLFFLDGISFEFDVNIWNRVTEKSVVLMNLPYNFNDDGCMDCPSFAISHNYKTNFNTSRTIEDFEVYCNFIRQEIINPIRQFRRNE